MRHGSSDAYKFAVHPGATPSRSGQAQTRYRGVTMGWEDINNTDNLTHVWALPAAGELICWEYPGDGLKTGDPEIWAVVNDSGVVQYAWEAEHRYDLDRNPIQPIIPTLQNGISIIPSGGVCIRLVMPGYANDPDAPAPLDALESEVAAADIPAWVEDTRYAGVAEPLELCEVLYRQMQQVRGFKVYRDLENTHNRALGVRLLSLYSLLWLRAASMVLYDHRGETCVPLVKARFTVDLTYGIVTV